MEDEWDEESKEEEDEATPNDLLRLDVSLVFFGGGVVAQGSE